MAGHRPSICKRRGCDAPRERWQLVCSECWKAIPRPTRDRYLSAKRRRLTKIYGDLGREILRLLGRKPADSAPAPTTYARIAAQLGERDLMEPAE